MKSQLDGKDEKPDLGAVESRMWRTTAGIGETRTDRQTDRNTGRQTEKLINNIRTPAASEAAASTRKWRHSPNILTRTAKKMNTAIEAYLSLLAVVNEY